MSPKATYMSRRLVILIFHKNYNLKFSKECKSVLSRHEVFIVPLVEWPIEQMEILSDQSGWPITVATIIMDWITESSSAYLSENMSILSCPELLSTIDE